MADAEWLVAGVIIGLLVGIPIGYLLSQLTKPKEPASVIFERDQDKYITAIHYVPGAKA
ncbi:MAG: hypothetical protein QXY39_07300 [Thermofilaceae archaeon]